MARVGSFSPSQYVVGAPLNVIHPIDNHFPQFAPEIEEMTGLSDEEKQKLQDQLDELNAALELARDQK